MRGLEVLGSCCPTPAGVCYDKARSGGPRPWQASIKVNGKKKHVGYYTTEEEAARAHDKAAREYRKDYKAILNFPHNNGDDDGRGEGCEDLFV